MYFFVAVFLLAALDPVPAAVPARPAMPATVASPVTASAPPGTPEPADAVEADRRMRLADAARARDVVAARRDVADLRRTQPTSPRLAPALRALGYAEERDQHWFLAVLAYIDAGTLDAKAKRNSAYAVDNVFAARDALVLHRYKFVRIFYASALALLQHPGDLQSPLANECRLGLAREYLRVGRWNAADDLLTQAERIDSGLRPWDEHARGVDLVARGEFELGREHYAKALTDFERGEGNELARSGVLGFSTTVENGPDFTHALLGLGADWSSLTESALGNFLAIANNVLVSVSGGPLRSPDLLAVQVADTRAETAVHMDSVTDTTDVIRSLQDFDRYAGSVSVETGEAYRALGELYFERADYAAAAQAYARARESYDAAVGSPYPELGEIDGALARTALLRGRPVEAIGYAKRSLRESATFDLGDGPVAETTTGVLARAEDADGRVAAAGSDYARSLASIRAVLARPGTFLTERQRLAFIDRASVAIGDYEGYLVARHPSDFTERLYDIALFGKEILGGSVPSVYAASASDPALQPLRARLARERELVAEQPPGAGAYRRIIDADLTEADLADAAAARDPVPAQPSVRWQTIRAALGAREAAVEYLHVGGSYVAVVLRSDSREPAIVSLGSAGDIATDVATYSSGVEPGGTGDPASSRALYARVWAPIVPALGSAERVFVAADGELDQVSFSILQRSDGADLIDLVDLRQLSSTKDLLAPAVHAEGKSAVVFADPAFEARIAGDAPPPRPNTNANVLDRPSSSAVVPGADADETRVGVRGGTLRPLPETEDELRDVASLLTKRGWTVDTYAGDAASKAAIEAVRQPRLLHVATHGYVLRDAPLPSEADRRDDFTDPMQRSMLFLAGAGRTWAKEDPPNSGLDNGVLTAYEASSLDLRGTELVVLSACETGLGRIQGGEGVLGLRRAFQEAGAQSVLSTLWQIPSADTVDLLNLFYAKWLGGENKYDALRDAQRAIRARTIARTGHDDPRTWGAFVLVGNGRG